MSSTGVSDWWIGQVDWATPAGRLVRQFVEALPQGKPRRFVVNGSAALQLTLDATWLSDGVDLFSSDDEDLTPLVETAGFGPGRGELYIEAGYSLSFRAGTRWPTRAKEYHIDGASVTIPHPIDILIGKLARLDLKDFRAFEMVIRLTGRPTPSEFLRELQMAVDLFRPAFEDDSPNLYRENTERLWRDLWGLTIDASRDIIAPALEMRRKGYGGMPPPYKRSLDPG